MLHPEPITTVGKTAFRRRKILMICAQLGYGGAEKSFVRLANYLSRHHDVTVALFAATYDGSYHKEGAEPLAVSVVLLSTGKGGVLKRWTERWKNLRDEKQKHDLAISFLSGPNLLNAITGSVAPAIVSVRGSRRHDTEGSWLWRGLWNGVLDPFTYWRSTCVVTASAGLAREVADRKVLRDTRKVVSIEGSIESAALVRTSDNAIEPEFESLNCFKLVVACGRLHPQKGFQYLIPIFEQVRRREAMAKLLIIGDGPELNNLLKICAGLGLRATHDLNDVANADVIFSGYRSNPVRYFRLANVFAFTSLYEGLPNALLEAVASGVPILAADCPWGTREILANASDLGGQFDDCNLPQKLPVGTLMPKINAPVAAAVWTEQLVEALQNRRQRASTEDRIARLAAFDMQASGEKWLNVIHGISRQSH